VSEPHASHAGVRLPPPDAIASIVCLMLGEIGDLMVAMPTVDRLRALYPRATVTLVVRDVVADLGACLPAVNQLVVFKGKTLLSKLALLARLATGRWDLFVDLHVPTFNTVSDNASVFRRNAWLMRAAGSRFRLGFATPETGPCLTHPVQTPAPAILCSENMVRTTLRLVNAAGEHATKCLVVPSSAEHWAVNWLERSGLAAVPLLGMFFGAKQPAKVWPVEAIARLLELVQDALPDHRVLLFGGPHEKPMAAALEPLGAFQPAIGAVDLIARTTLPQTAALMARCQAVVATDSGPLHMAEALGRPLVALFSAHNHPVWVPLRQDVPVLRSHVDCSPCLQSVCPKDNLCMRLITPEAVLASMLAVLRHSR
jgi:ADP-heptose:LPS heptosyltransferase